MATHILPTLTQHEQGVHIATLTRERLRKYLIACENDEARALRLYVLNAKISAAFFVDLHYVEVALRNKFAGLLASAYGHRWFESSAFLIMLKQTGADKVAKAKKDAARGLPGGRQAFPGKVIAELMFGFWAELTASHLEHTLWTPLLRRAFSGTPPARARFSGMLDRLRQLRNRCAHHEPIFHLALEQDHQCLSDVARMLCPVTALVMGHASTVHVEFTTLAHY